MVFNFEAQDFFGDRKNRSNAGWRQFYGVISDIVGVAGITAETKLVTKFCRTTVKSASIYATHSQGNAPCPVKFNLSTLLPIVKEKAEFVFKLSFVNGNNCRCGKLFWIVIWFQ